VIISPGEVAIALVNVSLLLVLFWRQRRLLKTTRALLETAQESIARDVYHAAHYRSVEELERRVDALESAGKPKH